MTVSSIAQRHFLNARLAETRTQIYDLQGQQSSGMKSGTLGGLGGSATYRALTLRADLKQIQGFKDITAQVGARAEVMSTSLTDISKQIVTAVGELSKILLNMPPDLKGVGPAAEEALSMIVSRLNTVYDGRFLFSGEKVDQQPYNNRTALDTSIAAIMANYASNGTGNVAAIQALTTTDVGYSAGYLAAPAAQVTTVQIDQRQTVTFDALADEAPIVDAIRWLGVFSQLSYTATNTAEFQDIFQTGYTALNQARIDIDTTASKLGATAARIDNTAVLLEQSQLTLETQLGTVEDVDVVTAQVRVDALTAQLQIGYEIINQLRELRLVNFLR